MVQYGYDTILYYNNNNNICLFQTHKIGTAYICRSIHIVIIDCANGSLLQSDYLF